MQLVNELKPSGGSLLCARLQTSAQLPRKPYPSSRHIFCRERVSFLRNRTCISYLTALKQFCFR